MKLIELSGQKESVSLELLNQTLYLIFEDLIHQVISFFDRRWNEPYRNKLDPFNENDDLDNILQCWDPHLKGNESTCKLDGNISKYDIYLLKIMPIGKLIIEVLFRLGKFVSSLLRDLTDAGLIWHMEDNALFNLITTHMSVVKNFTDAFKADTALSSALEKAGLERKIIDTIVNGYVNTNRVRIGQNYWLVYFKTSTLNRQLFFQNYTISEKIIEEKKEYERLLKYGDIERTNAVGRGLRKATNHALVIKAMNEAVDMQIIEINKSQWQREEFLNFAWLEGSSKMVQLVINDMIKITSGSKDIIQALRKPAEELAMEAFKLISDGTLKSILDGYAKKDRIAKMKKMTFLGFSKCLKRLRS